MACYDGNKDQGSCKEREVLKPFGLEASSVARFWALFLVPQGSLSGPAMPEPLGAALSCSCFASGRWANGSRKLRRWP